MVSKVPPTRYKLTMSTISGYQMPRPPSSADDYFFSIRATYLAVTPDSAVAIVSDELVEPQSRLLALGAERVRAIFSNMGCAIPDGAITSFAPAVAEFFQTIADEGRDYDDVVYLQMDLSAASYRNFRDIIPCLWTFLVPVEWDYVDHGGSGATDPDDFERDASESAAMVWTVPASKSSVEALEIVMIDTREHCTVCLEGYGCSGGDDCPAVRTPCWHVYHKRCIVRWLMKSHLCPFCRYAMPTSSD